jgi:hypothetical protein
MNLAKLENDLRKREIHQQNDNRLIHRAEIELEKFKAQAANSESSLKKLSRFNIQYVTNQELLKHKKIWFDEKERLDILRRVIEIQYEHFVSQILSRISPTDECYAVASEMSYDIDNRNFEAERKTLRERVSSLMELRKVTRSESQEDGFLESLDELNVSILKELEHLDTRCRKIARQLEKLPNHNKFDPEEFLNRWIEFNGQVRRFRDFKFQQNHLQEEHEKYCDELINGYRKQLEMLKAQLTTAHAISEKDYVQFQKLKEEYQHQVGDRFVLLCERVKKELPHLTKQQISELDDISNKRQLYLEKKSILNRVFLEQSNDLINHTFKSILDEEEFLKHQIEKDKLLQAKLEDMELRHFTLMKFREKKLEKMKLEAETRRLELEKQMQLESQRNEKERQRRMQTKNELAGYHQQLLQCRLEEEKIQKQLKEREEAEKRVMAKVSSNSLRQIRKESNSEPS